MGRIARHLELLNRTARETARAAGAAIYDGHPHSCGSTKRFVVNGGCIACNRARGKSPAHKKACKRWYTANTEAHKVLRDAWRKENKEEVREYNDNYRRKHLGMYTAHVQAYKAQKKRALPVWADLEAIQRFYEARPDGFHVDHIIPLRGKLVSGLHVENNLQYLPGIENIRKGNSYAA